MHRSGEWVDEIQNCSVYANIMNFTPTTNTTTPTINGSMESI